MVSLEKPIWTLNGSESGFLIDWLAFTTREHEPDEVIDILGLKGMDWERANGLYRYEEGLYWQNIKILFGSKAEEMKGTVNVQMSGKGCRAYETFGACDWLGLFRLHQKGAIKATRIDPAFDDRDLVLNLFKLAEDTELLEEHEGKMRFARIVSEFKSAKVEHFLPDRRGMIILWGSRSSNTFFRIYDKAKQLKQHHMNWIRFEMQLRDLHAQNFINTAITDYNGNWQKHFMELLHKKVRVVHRPEGNHDTNIRRLPMAPYWLKFVGNMAKAKPYPKLPMEYGQENLQRYTIHQAGQAVEAYVEIVGLENYLKEIKNHRDHEPLDKKYQAVVDTANILSRK